MQANNTQNTVHSMRSRDMCLGYFFIEHPYNEVRVWQARGVWWQL